MRSRLQSGFSLVELMVAGVLGLLLVAAVSTVYAGLKTSAAAQDELVGLHERERAAILLLTQVVRAAGFRPNPMSVDAASAFPAESSAQFGNLQAGQALAGTVRTSNGSDTLTVRFLADGEGLARDCIGVGAYPAGTVVTSRFFRDAGGGLSCKAGNSNAEPLLDNLAGFSVSYGVDTDPACSPCQPRRYMDASQVAAAGAWGRVRVLRLTFRLATGAASPSTVQWTQAVALMNP